ncbi:hypothetical protein [uncultured Duncaniella sp.]|uniref:hypothetical protein n=1 Tax=uncultured Duncaniella sp. TaxID=2768039 RepID=UPI0025B6805F|nr:hypothetical protein [uncultured Duncaniella sp.]
MSEQEKIDLRERIYIGLKESYKKLLRRKAALGQDMVFADENGMPRIVPAREALIDYEKKHNNK